MSDETIPCFRCLRNTPDVGNPFGAAILEIDPVSTRGGPVQLVLCDECVPGLVEYLNPDLAASPGYIAQKDQYRAAVRDFRQGIQKR